jgi:NAD(P)-dependent dehydrogenase (short-subunit alcohol dehydrogenase family)
VKTVLVAGAAGGIGEGIVLALLAAGNVRVIGTSRTADRLDALRKHIEPEAAPAFTGILGDAGDFAGAASIVERVEALGGADVAVAILGRGTWSSGNIVDLPPSEWTSVLGEMLTSHFAFARAVVPMLANRAGSLYLSIGGGAAFEPARDAGLMSIAAAGQAMLTRVLAKEAVPGRPRVVELVIDGAVKSRESGDDASSELVTVDDVGRVAVELILRGAATWEQSTTSGPLIVMKERR